MGFEQPYSSITESASRTVDTIACRVALVGFLYIYLLEVRMIGCLCACVLSV